ncbi:MAG: phenylacetate--CoA ligase family protein [Myxococcales bacterium]|nr:phenylacetate--CoA ligase family protein [Myxococcales bacterium]
MAFDAYGAVLGRVLYPAWERLRGRPTFPLLHQLQRSERISLDELTAQRTGYLRRLIRHAYHHTAHYRALFDAAGLHPSDITTLSDLRSVPLLPRAIAQTTVETRTAPYPVVAVSKATSGSTGQPLEVRFSAESRHWRDATRWRGFGWGGYHMGDKAMHLWGLAAVPPSALTRAKIAIDRKLRRDIYASCMVRSNENLHEMVELIRSERPQVLAGYGQALADLARYVNREGLRSWDTIPVIYGAERLWDHDRADLAQAFGPAVFETYGCREFMLMGSECEAHDGLHESAENLIVELVVREPDGSTRPALPGEQGEVAVTDLHNLACPFIRYLTGDLATARAQAPCPCGRTLPRFGAIDGRITDTMRDAAGNPVEGILFNILFLNMAKHTRQFQAIQRRDGSLLLKVVPTATGRLPAEVERLIREFVGKHLRGIALTIELVTEIPLTTAGKLRRVVVEAGGWSPSHDLGETGS